MPFCKKITKSGNPCKCHCAYNFDFCYNHSPDCPICLEKLVSENVQELQCGHMFHNKCLEKWLEENHTCPYCRSLVDHHIIFDDNLTPQDLDMNKILLVLIAIQSLKPMKLRIKKDEKNELVFLREVF